MSNNKTHSTSILALTSTLAFFRFHEKLTLGAFLSASGASSWKSSSLLKLNEDAIRFDGNVSVEML